MNSILGLNFSIDHTADVEKRDTFHRALAPAYSVAMIDSAKDVFRIRKVELDYPDTVIIGRTFHKLQGGFHLKPEAKEDAGKEFVASPEDIADQMDEAGYRIGIEGKSWAYVLNEPMGNGDPEPLDRLFRWNSRWMDKSITQRRRSVMFNWGDREPATENGMWNERWQALLKRMAAHPDIFMVGLHFYGPDKLIEVMDAYLKTCEYLKIDPLRVVGTEFGVDTDAGSLTNGYRSRGWTGDQMGQWIEKSVASDLAPYIKSGVLAGLQLFTWNNNPQWSAFDIAGDEGLQKYLLDAKKRGVFDIITTPAPKPTPKPKPSDSLYVTFPSDFATRSQERFVKPTRGNQFIRSAPSVTASKMPIVLQSAGERCDIILAPNLKPEEQVTSTISGTKGFWLPIKIGNVEGWVFGGFITAEFIPEKTITSEVPAVVLLPPPQEVFPAPVTPSLPPIVPMVTLPLSSLESMKKRLLASIEEMNTQISVLDFYIQREKA